MIQYKYKPGDLVRVPSVEELSYYHLHPVSGLRIADEMYAYCNQVWEIQSLAVSHGRKRPEYHLDQRNEEYSWYWDEDWLRPFITVAVDESLLSTLIDGE